MYSIYTHCESYWNINIKKKALLFYEQTNFLEFYFSKFTLEIEFNKQTKHKQISTVLINKKKNVTLNKTLSINRQAKKSSLDNLMQE